jgi:hypothetical protein
MACLVCLAVSDWSLYLYLVFVSLASPVPADKLRHRCVFTSQCSRRPCDVHASRFCFESSRRAGGACSLSRAGRDHARHYPLARVLPFLYVSFAGGSSLSTFLPPLRVRPVYAHFP